MKYSIETLMAFVDGNLDTNQKLAISASAELDHELAQMIATLEASQLPYNAAFKAVRTPPIPNELQERVTEWTSIANAKEQQPQEKKRRVIGIAAAILVAVLAGYTGGQIWPIKNGITPSEIANNVDSLRSWAELVADYQSLYVAETVSHVRNGEQDAQALFDRLKQQTDISPKRPNLNSLGYAFVRAQQLGYDSQPLVQLIYRNDKGDLLALCYMRDELPNQSVLIETHGAMLSAVWRAEGQRYVIIGGQNESLLSQIQSKTASAWL